MKTLITTFILFVSITTWAQQQTVDSSFHLYLLIGQSNMAGRGTPDAQSKIVNPRIMMMDSLDRWVPATDPVHFDKPKLVGVGPGISFATEMLREQNNLTIGLIPCALGGSPIDVWRPGKTYLEKFHPYEDVIRRCSTATRCGILKGILWHQGESDNDSLHAAAYLDQLKILINRLRTDLSQPMLPFVAGEIGLFNTVNYINPIIDQLPQHVPYTAVVSAVGLSDKGDHLHFDTSSARLLGKRYAVAMKACRPKN
jgi:hypothetical protein